MNPPSEFLSTRMAPLWVVLAFIVGMTIYSQVGKHEASSNDINRDLSKTFPRNAYAATYEQSANSGKSIIYLYCDGKGKVRLESTMPNSNAVSSTIVDFINKKRYFIDERQKTYIVANLAKTGLAGFDEEMFKSVKAESLGKATVNGIVCRGYKTALPNDKSAVVESWFDDKNGWLVQSTVVGTANGAKLIRFANRQPKATMFEVPQGFKQTANTFQQ
jgi:hypothetical protein